MTRDTKYQRAKIIVEEVRKLYLQILLSIGLFIFIAIRTTFTKGQSINVYNSIAINNSANSHMTIIQSPFFIVAYVGVVFSIVILYKYLKIHLLKRKFKDKEKGNEKLKKYMKSKDIPKKEDINNKFSKDKIKTKKKFYRQIAIIVILIITLIIVNNYYNLLFLDIIIVFAILNLFYRYLFIFHLDKKILSEKWENEKIRKYIKEFDF